MAERKHIAINKLTHDAQLIIRGNLDEDAISRYADLYREGKEKAIVAQAGTYKVIDGYHRVKAAQMAGINEILAEIKPIPDEHLRSEAIRLNRDHGVPIPKKARDDLIVKLRFEDHRTQKEIAEILGVSLGLVSEKLKRLREFSDFKNENAKPESTDTPSGEENAKPLDLRKKVDEKEIIEDWLKGFTYDQIASDWGITNRRFVPEATRTLW